jgi:ribose 5-phosphate isomerase B
MHDEATATSFVDVFLATPFSHDPRHQRRIDQVAAYEADPVAQTLPES